MREFRVNEYLTVKLEDDNTNIYVNKKYFRQCMYLLLKKGKIDEINDYLDHFKSVDEEFDRLDNSLKRREREIFILPEEEFWAHCSNLQIWAENNYDSNLLHSNLAFPLLKELVNIGDVKAIKVFKEEIVKRFKSEVHSVVLFLINEGYLGFLNYEELWTLFNKQQKKIFLEFERLNGFNPLINVRSFNKDKIDIEFKNGKIIKLVFNYEKLKKLPENIGSFKDVNEITIKNTQLKCLPNSISELSSIRNLDLRSNKINSIINKIGDLRHLNLLDLSDNQLKELPNSIGELESLKELYLNENYIFELPNSLGNLRNLTHLDLSFNEITHIPETLRNLKNLKTLNLSNNHIDKIPKFIKKLKTINSLVII